VGLAAADERAAMSHFGPPARPRQHALRDFQTGFGPWSWSELE
jgi:hypothetical protein